MLRYLTLAALAAATLFIGFWMSDFWHDYPHHTLVMNISVGVLQLMLVALLIALWHAVLTEITKGRK